MDGRGDDMRRIDCGYDFLPSHEEMARNGAKW
jgi:hypothetical protein